MLAEFRVPSSGASEQLGVAKSEALLKELVNIDSPTNSVSGVNLVQSVIADELAKLGFTTRFVRHAKFDGTVGNLLVAEKSGKVSEYITMVSHADTVLGSFLPTRFWRDASGTKAFGSGVIDNKGGIVVAIESLRLYLKAMQNIQDEPHYSLRFVCSPNEETGSGGFHDLFRDMATDSVLILGFEPALENGSIIKSRRGNCWYNLKVVGQEAHSGRCKGEEINAAHEMALKFVKLHQLNSAEAGTNVNVGSFHGGRDRYNVVCGAADAKIDARFPDFETRDNLHSRIDSILLKSYLTSQVTGVSAKCEYTIADDCPPFAPTYGSESILRFLTERIGFLEGRPISAEQGGGAGDVNHMSREGLPVIDGLGPVGGGMHTNSEFIVLSSINTRASAIALMLQNTPELLLKSYEGEPYVERSQVIGKFTSHKNL
jgi:glutamate carboxypeptidase